MTTFNSKNNRRCGIGAILMAAGLLVSVPAAAMVSVQPEVQKVEFKDGKKTVGYIRVTNTTDHVLRIEVQSEDWTSVTGRRDAKDIPWLAVGPKSFKLKPGRTKKVKLTAVKPDDKSFSRLTQVFFAIRDAGKAGDIAIGMRIGSLVQWRVHQSDQRAE